MLSNKILDKPFFIKITIPEQHSGEMVQKSGRLVALAEEADLVPSSHAGQLTTVCDSIQWIQSPLVKSEDTAHMWHTHK